MISSDIRSALSTKQLMKRFGSAVACDSIDLDICPGITFGLLGPNGAGKSTFIRMLMGLTQIDGGEAKVLGYDPGQRDSTMREKVGYVPELHFIYRWMTVKEVIRFVSRLYKNWNKSLSDSLLDQFELPRDKRVSSLSKGMTAKLGLLLALAHEPELLILDEPTSGLDPIIREDFLESVLRCHAETKRTVLFSSHHVDDVERVSDEVGVMNNGKLVLLGSVDSLRNRVKRISAVLKDGRLPNWMPPETIFMKLSRRQWTITVDHYSDEMMEAIRAKNDVIAAEANDLCLEEMFKDVVRGSKSDWRESVQ